MIALVGESLDFIGLVKITSLLFGVSKLDYSTSALTGELVDDFKVRSAGGLAGDCLSEYFFISGMQGCLLEGRPAGNSFYFLVRD